MFAVRQFSDPTTSYGSLKGTLKLVTLVEELAGSFSSSWPRILTGLEGGADGLSSAAGRIVTSATEDAKSQTFL